MLFNEFNISLVSLIKETNRNSELPICNSVRMTKK